MYPLVLCFVCFVMRTLNMSLPSMNFEVHVTLLLTIGYGYRVDMYNLFIWHN